MFDNSLKPGVSEQCQGPRCGKKVEQSEGGGRIRKYCSDACRYRAAEARRQRPSRSRYARLYDVD